MVGHVDDVHYIVRDVSLHTSDVMREWSTPFEQY